ncbi:AAA family ATPase [Bacillus weihaiensis]|uniref:Nuclease SbcCD subunit C n=1 Tax=Bacillus weihaiensis TaxID=1547283 RepID=A0A1L3MUF1_9BACI|nr:SMC family ATPase [Bacillus weihaiensis]APH05975.1 hypothetical protein A9C19_15215 [Bacillus weihaiensis]
MKPIQLSVAGLHSFREKQTIDFDSLCDGGIFGIFGPTGSGKSSILDAMTLALYGKVERAMNNTHGILNHAEEKLTVSFTFELENASAKKRYIVERTFKRTDEIKVKTSICRLIEVSTEHVVLADKAVEVNEKVYGLLGLTIDDFTRAVVLPQGKFAEFLSLKGAERRQMLQRLFHLEQYGDKMLKKLKKRLTLAKAKHNELEAEKTGLGDASKEAVKAAESDVEQAENLLEKRTKELEQVTKEFEEKQEVWKLQQEQENIEKDKRVLLLNEADIKRLRVELKRAEEAEFLRPYAEALQRSQSDYRDAKQQLHDNEATFHHIKKQYDETTKAYEAIRKEKSEEEPKLVAKREKLVQLEKVEQELLQDKKQLAQLTENNNKLKERHQASEELLVKATQLVEKALSKQQDLKEEQKKMVVTTKEREQISSASDLKQQVVQINQQLDEVSEVVRNKQNVLEVEKNQQKVLQKQLTDVQVKLREEYESLTQLFFVISERENEYNHFLQMCKKRVEDELTKQEEVKAKELAFELVNQLQEGAPCPVCGSTHHPDIAQKHDQNRPESDEITKQLKQELETLQSIQYEPQSLKVKAEALSQQLVSEFSFLHEFVSKEQSERNGLLSGVKDPTIRQGFDVFHTEFKALNQDFLQAKTTTERLVKQLRQLRQETQRKEDFISSTAGEEKEWEEKQRKIETKLVEVKQTYSELFPHLPFAQLEQLQQEMRQKDESFELLNERIQKSVMFIEEQQEMVKTQEKLAQKLIEEQIEIDTTISNRKAMVNEKQEKLKQAGLKNPFHQEIQETEATLRRLVDTEKELYDLWQQTSMKLQKKQSDLAAAEKTFERATGTLSEANQKWNMVKEDTSFQSVEETLASILSSTGKQELKNKIEEYEDKLKQLTTDLQRVTEKLAGRKVTLEEWSSMQQIRLEMQKMVNEAVEAKGAAARVVEELLSKHIRFSEIEVEQKELSTLLQHLEKLQSVFKGNSFVEYVAQEQLQQVSRDASERLSILTRGRYAIEVDSQGGFTMRDDANGGVRRPVSTLSGGETFLTSLALALSLSTQIQLRGEYPLQFFFLDEGFGTLDIELLDTVITALEKLQAQNLSVGVISHVQELRARLPRKLIVNPAEPSGKGTTVHLESL